METNKYLLLISLELEKIDNIDNRDALDEVKREVLNVLQQIIDKNNIQ